MRMHELIVGMYFLCHYTYSVPWLPNYLAKSLQNKIYIIFRVLSAFVKDSRQYKQHQKRLFKVVTVNLPFYKQLYNVLKSCNSWCGDSQTWAPKIAEKSAVRKAN